MTNTLSNCKTCSFQGECGGLDGQQALLGCFHLDHDQHGCTEAGWTCPCRPLEFIRRFADVGGLAPRSSGPVRGLPAGGLPFYVPMLRNGSSRTRLFAAPIVAISTFDLLGGRSADSYGPKVRTMVDLSARFRIPSTSRVLLVSVAPDLDLERYWAYRNSRSVPDALRTLGVTAVTIPNYSFFQDAPRTHTVRNRRRMEIVAEELSAAGIAVVPHLNALTRADWKYWGDYLRQHESVTCVAKEFQTGLRDPELAREAIDAIRDLENRIGRSLHLIAVAGGRCVPQLAQRFGRFTVVDSMPFMKAMKRRRLVLHGRIRWRRHRVPLVDDLLAHNVEGYTAHLEETAARFRQLELPDLSVDPRTRLDLREDFRDAASSESAA